MPVSWVEHRGQRILYVDDRNLGPTECVDTLREQAAAIGAAPEPVLTLEDARGQRRGDPRAHVAGRDRRGRAGVPHGAVTRGEQGAASRAPVEAPPSPYGGIRQDRMISALY